MGVISNWLSSFFFCIRTKQNKNIRIGKTCSLFKIRKICTVITCMHVSTSSQSLPTLIIFNKTVPNFTDGDYPTKLFLTETGFINSQYFTISQRHSHTIQTNREWSLFVDNGQCITTHIIFILVVMCIIYAMEIFSFLPSQVITFNPWTKFLSFLRTTHMKLPGR